MAIDKGRKISHEQSDLLGQKPYGSIGPGRSTQEAAIVGKLKKKKADSLKAEGSTSQSGERANVGGVSKLIGHFVNK